MVESVDYDFTAKCWTHDRPVTPLFLPIQPLTAQAFAPFGDVIETAGHSALEINHGHTSKYADLACVNTTSEGGQPAIHIYRSSPVSLPLRIETLERHPLGSQAFIPLQAQPFLIVVAPAGDAPMPSDVRGFFTNGKQGINFHKGVWHHYQITLGETADYLVIDRLGPGENFDEHRLDQALVMKAVPW